MDRLDQLSAFVAVVDAGGFSAAARVRGLPQPFMSKAVSALERRLGVILLNRNTRSISLTEQGRVFYERARPLLEQIADVEGAATEGARTVEGLIRLGAPATFGRLHVLPHATRLLAEHPGLSVEVVLDDAVRDMVEDGIDLAIRVGPVRDLDVVVRPIAKTPLVCVASRSYLDAHGAPALPADLARHNCLVYGRGPGADEWIFSGPDKPQRLKVRGNLRSNSAEAIRAAVLEGVGIGMMTKASLSGELDRADVVSLLTSYLSLSLDVSLVWPRRRLVTKRARRTADFLSGAIAAGLARASDSFDRHAKAGGEPVHRGRHAPPVGE